MVGSGRSTTETRQVSDFHAVNFAFIGDLNITQGNQEALTISGDDNILALIRSEVRAGVLRIDAGATNLGQTIVPLRYDLVVRNLDEVELSGLGNIKLGALQSDAPVSYTHLDVYKRQGRSRAGAGPGKVHLSHQPGRALFTR